MLATGSGTENSSCCYYYISFDKHWLLLYYAVILFASIKSPLSSFILFKFPKQPVTYIFKVNTKAHSKLK